MARGGSGAGFLLHAAGTVLRPPRFGGSQQGALVQGRMRDCHSNVAGNQTPHSGHGGSRRGLPPAIRPGRQHDSLLHSQAQEIISHVQELRHYQYLEFQIDLRRDHCLRSIVPSSQVSRCTQQEPVFSRLSVLLLFLEDSHRGSRRFQSRQIRKCVFVKNRIYINITSETKIC